MATMQRVIIILASLLISQNSFAWVELIINGSCYRGGGTVYGEERFSACMKKEHELQAIVDRLNQEERELVSYRDKLDNQASTLSQQRQTLDADQAKLVEDQQALATARQQVDADQRMVLEKADALKALDQKTKELAEKEIVLKQREREVSEQQAAVQKEKETTDRKAADLEQRERALQTQVHEHGQAILLLAKDREAMDLLKAQLLSLEGTLTEQRETLEAKQRELSERERALEERLAHPPTPLSADEKAHYEAELEKLRKEKAAAGEALLIGVRLVGEVVPLNYRREMNRCKWTIGILAVVAAAETGYLIRKSFFEHPQPATPPTTDKPKSSQDPVYEYLESRITMDSTPYTELLKAEIDPLDPNFKASLTEGKEAGWIAKSLSLRLYGKLEERMSFDKRTSTEILEKNGGGGTSTEKAYLLYKWLIKYCEGKQCPAIDLKIGTLNEKGIGVLRTHLPGRDEMPDEKIPRTVGWVTVGEKSYCPSFKYEGLTKEFESDFIGIDTIKKISP